MQRFFVLGENTLCAINSKPEIGPFLRGQLSFQLTVLFSYDPLLKGRLEEYQPKGYPKLRLANKSYLVFFLGSKAEEFFPAIEAQERETNLNMQELTEFSTTFLKEFLELSNQVLQDAEALKTLPESLLKNTEKLKNELGKFDDRLKRLEQEDYNAMVLGKMFEQLGDRNTGCAIDDTMVDWERLSDYKKQLSKVVKDCQGS